jgi:uncharacterized membrane protein
MLDMWKKLKTRIRNPKVITAIVSGILMILVNLNIIDVHVSDKVLEVVNYILGFGVSIGVFGNPESHVSE